MNDYYKPPHVESGDYIAVISMDYREEKFVPKFDFEWLPKVEGIEAEPLKVLAVTNPLILCEPVIKTNVSKPMASPLIGGMIDVTPKLRTVTVDCRHERYIKLPPEFVRHFRDVNTIETPDDEKTEEEKQEKKQSEQRKCPICLNSMSEILVDENWCLSCKECQRKFVPI